MVIRRCNHGQVSVKQWLLEVPLFVCLPRKLFHSVSKSAWFAKQPRITFRQ